MDGGMHIKSPSVFLLLALTNVYAFSHTRCLCYLKLQYPKCRVELCCIYQHFQVVNEVSTTDYDFVYPPPANHLLNA